MEVLWEATPVGVSRGIGVLSPTGVASYNTQIAGVPGQYTYLFSSGFLRTGFLASWDAAELLLRAFLEIAVARGRPVLSCLAHHSAIRSG